MLLCTALPEGLINPFVLLRLPSTRALFLAQIVCGRGGSSTQELPGIQCHRKYRLRFILFLFYTRTMLGFCSVRWALAFFCFLFFYTKLSSWVEEV